MNQYDCPECGEPVHEVRRTPGFIPIAMHRDSYGKKCAAVGRNLLHYRWQALLKVVLHGR